MNNNILFVVDGEHNVFVRCVRSAFIKGVEFGQGEKLHFHWNTYIGLFQCERSNRYRPGDDTRRDITLTSDESLSLDTGPN